MVGMATSVCIWHTLYGARGPGELLDKSWPTVLWKEEQKSSGEASEDKMEENGLSERVLGMRSLVPGKVKGANARMG